jgi:hypothetical protein
MKFTFEKGEANIIDLFQKAGYSYRGVNNGDMSFIKRAGRDEYPHYHIYVKTEGENVILNMHFDQKRPSYEGASAHNADYDGELVEKEMERIKEVIKSASH